jgi:NADH:ubiquinone oxidoreductase subunit 4 (subunit M)
MVYSRSHHRNRHIVNIYLSPVILLLLILILIAAGITGMDCRKAESAGLQGTSHCSHYSDFIIVMALFFRYDSPGNNGWMVSSLRTGSRGWDRIHLALDGLSLIMLLLTFSSASWRYLFRGRK